MAARKHVAGQKAEKLLGRVPLPGGAQLTRAAPAELRYRVTKCGGFLSCPCSVGFACRHHFWKLRAPVAAVRSFVKRHVLAGYRQFPTFSQLNGLGFYLPGWRGYGPHWYVVAAVRMRAWTFVRVDAAMDWIYPRSPRQLVPAGVREVDIRGYHFEQAVTNTRDVEKIVGWFDGLDVIPPSAEATGCGAIGTYMPTLGFVFRTADRTRVAGAVVPSGPASSCQSITFAIGGKAQWPLMDVPDGQRAWRHSFIWRVRRLLGSNLG